ncbi:MAG: hypothetical protein M1834_002157 [Cirrosporium novae-zelandiae]|nr:MAG: hypothetical protein M1834_002157 [Cirrosporium novae-zelandiae]
MTTTASETEPLLSPHISPSTPSKSVSPRPQRTVTFNPITTASLPSGASTISSALQPPSQPSPSFQTGHTGSSTASTLSALNNKLSRRHSHGSPYTTQPMFGPPPKVGPQRTTKNAQKLKFLPTTDPAEEVEESGRDVYSQFTKIKEPRARQDAARLGKADRDRLPRVTAYCTASAYRLDGLMKFLKSRVRTRGANPKQFDECIYSPYNYNFKTKGNVNKGTDVGDGAPRPSLPDPPLLERRHSDSVVDVQDFAVSRPSDLIDLTHTASSSNAIPALPSDTSLQLPSSLQPLTTSTTDGPELDTEVHTPEVFLFEYGTVVIWGMTPQQELRFLRDISKFESEKLASDDVQTENFNFYYTREYQARIYNDFISLMDKKNYMTKLAISHALSQSVKTSLFEDLVTTTIAATSSLPTQIASTGSVNMSRRQINMRIGELFILRINIHLQGSVLDSPELMWAEPQLEPIYSAVRSYLEMNQRVALLTERLSVIADLLAVLKDQLSHRHSEYLEWIVIILIAAEILVAAVNIVVDLYAGV